jgi:hypothetical protein
MDKTVRGPFTLRRRVLRAVRLVLGRKRLVELLQAYLERVPPCCM